MLGRIQAQRSCPRVEAPNAGETSARMANSKDGHITRICDGRFKSQWLLDENAMLSSMAYIDSSSFRAGRGGLSILLGYDLHYVSLGLIQAGKIACKMFVQVSNR